MERVPASSTSVVVASTAADTLLSASKRSHAKDLRKIARVGLGYALLVLRAHQHGDAVVHDCLFTVLLRR
jgi:hypothetical protein